MTTIAPAPVAAQAAPTIDPLKPIDSAPIEGSKPQIPEWVAEKFRNDPDPVAAQAKAYAEAEKAKTKAEQDAAAKKAEDSKTESAVAKAGLSMEALTAEYLANDGKLSEASYAAFQKAGIEPDVVNAGVEAMVARAEAVKESFYTLAGGEDAFGAVVQWAQKNVKPAELDAYNLLINQGNYDAAKLVFQSFISGYEATTSRLPERTLKATAAANLTGIKPFSSRVEMSEAMSNPKYRTDPAYREAVYARVAVTDF